MSARMTNLLLLVGLVFTSFLVAAYRHEFVLPGNNRGFEPPQPIRFSHRLHAGELEIACLYCHSSAEKSRHAGIPPASTCMNCHRFVTASFADVQAENRAALKEKREPRQVVSAELRKLYDALALGPDLKPDPSKTPKPIEWVRVHDLPDFVFFPHHRHVMAGVACQKCHGPVETMERVRQDLHLSMGFCVNCHRDVNEGGLEGKAVHASTDCVVCHY